MLIIISEEEEEEEEDDISDGRAEAAVKNKNVKTRDVARVRGRLNGFVFNHPTIPPNNCIIWGGRLILITIWKTQIINYRLSSKHMIDANPKLRTLTI